MFAIVECIRRFLPLVRVLCQLLQQQKINLDVEIHLRFKH